MLALGLILIAAGAAALALGLFTTDDEGTTPAEMLGVEIGATAIFIVGVFSGIAILLGVSLVKFGTKRGLKHRRETKQLAELSQKLDRAEAERKKNDTDESR